MKIAVISASEATLELIAGYLREGGSGHVVATFRGGIETLGGIVDQERPDLAVLEGLCQDEELAVLEQVGARHPGMAFLMLCEHISTDFLLRAMRSGVRDVMPLSVTAESLRAAVTRIGQIGARPATPSVKKARTVAFIACKGGSGATFLAANLAYALAAHEQQEVALIDLNFQLGDALLFIHDQPPKITIADIAANISRLDAAFLYSCMVHVLPNLHVLPAPEDPEHAFDIRPEHVDKLLHIAASRFDWVVLDVGRSLQGSAVKALDHAQVIFPVLQETLPFIRDAKRLLAAFRSLGYPKEKIHLLLNRYEKGGDITLQDVESTLGMNVAMEIPNSFKVVSASVNQGIAMCKLAPHDAVTKVLHKMSHDLVHGREKSGGWFSRLLSHG